MQFESLHQNNKVTRQISRKNRVLHRFYAVHTRCRSILLCGLSCCRYFILMGPANSAFGNLNDVTKVYIVHSVKITVMCPKLEFPL